MRNTLKFSLLGTLLCSVSIMFSNVYSTEHVGESTSDSNSKYAQNDNIRGNIDNISVCDDPLGIYKYVNTLRSIRKERNKNNEKIIKYQDAYEKYKSLQQILIFPQRELSHADSERYNKYIADNYNNFATSTKKYIDGEYSQYNEQLKEIYHTEYIKKLADNLLKDNVRFISEYSPSDDINCSSNCLFKAAWSIIFYYANNTNMNDLFQNLLSLYNNILGPNMNIKIYDGNYTVNNNRNINNIDISMTDEDLQRYIKKNPKNIVLNSGSMISDFPKTVEIYKQKSIDFIINKYSTEELTKLINSLLQEYISFVNNYDVMLNEKPLSIFCDVWKKVAYYVFFNTNSAIGSSLQNRISLLLTNTLPFVFKSQKLDYKFILKQFLGDYIDTTSNDKLQNALKSIFTR